ncbi:MAG TPA: response regulator transcription factor [Streptomyces sp.]|uniref:response regulator transcription factor n=1 Tax=Streptomyces sp. TaxID=1931 RepID=UPI002C738AA3|nr:response regulator transcription factor [Streptomyces sp.]HWU10238.1 response regulator transcription factor [Streptomyces sp.]
MPDDFSRTSGQDWAAQNHASQHTSAHANPLPSELSSPGFPATRRHAASELMPSFPAPGPLRVVVADDNPVVRAGLGVLLSGREDIEVVAEAADGRQAYEMAVQHRPDVVLLDVRMPGVDGISALPHLVRVAPVMMLTYSRESEIVHEALRLGAGGYLVHGEFTADQLVQAVRDTKSGRAHFTATAANALLAHMRQGPAPQGGGPLPDGLGTALTSTSRHGAPAHAPVPQSPPPATRPGPVARGLSQVQPIVAQSTQTAADPATAPNSPQHGLSSREVEVMELIASGMSNQQIAATCFISEKTVKNHINRIFTKLQSGSRSEAIARWLGTAPGGRPGLGGR